MILCAGSVVLFGKDLIVWGLSVEGSIFQWHVRYVGQVWIFRVIEVVGVNGV